MILSEFELSKYSKSVIRGNSKGRTEKTKNKQTNKNPRQSSEVFDEIKRGNRKSVF